MTIKTRYWVAMEVGMHGSKLNIQYKYHSENTVIMYLSIIMQQHGSFSLTRHMKVNKSAAKWKISENVEQWWRSNRTGWGLRYRPRNLPLISHSKLSATMPHKTHKTPFNFEMVSISRHETPTWIINLHNYEHNNGKTESQTSLQQTERQEKKWIKIIPSQK